MNVLARSPRDRLVVIAGVATFVWLAFVAATFASAAVLPSPCTLLAKLHPERAFGAGKTLAVKHVKLQKYGAGQYTSVSCSETVGAQPVILNLSGPASGGFGGVKVTSQTHPSGLGAGATLTVGTALGSGGPVDFVAFHKSSVSAVLTANGASPSALTAFARQIYKALP
jgi:hypothetical protein